MVMILSSQKDQSTNWVIDWIAYKEYDFQRINADDIYFLNSLFTIDMSSEAKILFTTISSNISSIWLRRWFNLSLNFNSSNNQENNELKRVVNIVLDEEFQSLSNFFFKHFANKKWLTTIETFWINKLYVLEIAHASDFDIPQTIVTSDKKQVSLFLQKYERIITKPISEVVMFDYKGHFYSSLTREITEAEINMAQTMPMSLFQEFLDIYLSYFISQIWNTEDIDFQ